MTYSIDFRRKVLKVKQEENLTLAAVAKRFQIAIASVVRWSKVLEAKGTRNRPTKIDMEALKQDVELYPDAYHYERAVRFGITEGGIRHALKRLGISRKKNPQTSQSQPRSTANLPRQNELL
ncbi:IS630 transposase-related protein [Beggiatoa leptomitoformis]|uniref:Transposase n=1 Tax=Beggiatoa leptomitoformis TaxID=288004 RepID=A0A2N9YDV3_9GAMM|nr:IS630 transposase-related protein [Beggiatoa leptomitoformis]ALG68942.1 transposase [Beggiatoa leptomitoformis]AUI68673.1 transposase [Beggiatoa leptomitoformis]